jgi:hypothetical protein
MIYDYSIIINDLSEEKIGSLTQKIEKINK